MRPHTLWLSQEETENEASPQLITPLCEETLVGPEFHGIHAGKCWVPDLFRLSTFKVDLGSIWPGTGGLFLLVWKEPHVWRYLKEDLGLWSRRRGTRYVLWSPHPKLLTFGPEHPEEKFWLSMRPQKESAKLLYFSAHCSLFKCHLLNEAPPSALLYIATPPTDTLYFPSLLHLSPEHLSPSNTIYFIYLLSLSYVSPTRSQHEGGEFFVCLLSLVLYLQHLEQYPAQNKHSVYIYWMNKWMQVRKRKHWQKCCTSC